jgi:hypothetical protein
VAERAGEHRDFASAINLIDKVIKKDSWWSYVGARQQIKTQQPNKPRNINGGGIRHDTRQGGT